MSRLLFSLLFVVGVSVPQAALAQKAKPGSISAQQFQKGQTFEVPSNDVWPLATVPWSGFCKAKGGHITVVETVEDRVYVTYEAGKLSRECNSKFYWAGPQILYDMWSKAAKENLERGIVRAFPQ